MEKPMDVASKKDDSPVTAADIAAHKVIMSGLQALTPDIPVLSEEDPPAGSAPALAALLAGGSAGRHQRVYQA
jgi:3'-phosphoadenosine 5'-phosphosulfate (PAPS) 3'-phosphatase